MLLLLLLSLLFTYDEKLIQFIRRTNLSPRTEVRVIVTGRFRTGFRCCPVRVRVRLRGR
jgi:tetraacyldisaccharide-1-P 4'-kinase